MASLFSPFRRSYNYMYRSAHEYPAIFYSVVLGCLGPILVVTVPPIRERLGYTRRGEEIPTSYPLARRARRPVQGYDDE
ncbi:nadh-ubiquinone oxidoreductase kda subunit [Moniliophthora roreri MCA 2997]|uniref:Nadh-ubiquinone oxidoreductase kDa subunit n=2 Tax=Moniliophthora roreri TaxID=221103 RepID=V2XQ60_MONRO|nr:nadh-ubiquinone oxidoreductase kda subunit [Moniliophthora roreri MCA 2997]KAI3604792.1 nadh-ubiquinone oxidoreductase kda subunit [Moniliophthora roreri]